MNSSPKPLKPNTEPIKRVTKKNPALPLVAAVLGVGLLAFLLGRGTAPNPPAPGDAARRREPMNSESPTPLQSKKKSAPWPIIGAVVGVGLLAFVVGRATSPDPPASMGTSETATKEHGEEGHAEGEEGHEEGGHAEGEEGHEEGGHGGGEEIVFEGDSLKTAGVQVAPVALALQTSGIPFNGEIEASPNRVVRVSSVVPGRVTRLYVSIGDKVRRGQTVAVVESRAIGEAQSAYQQAVARFNNARSNLNVVLQQARAGVFSRAPIEAARRTQVEAAADVRAQESAVRQARVVLDNVLRQARIGTFASPALEAARAQSAEATQALRTSEAALTNARASVEAAQQELERRRQLAAGGAYVSRPVEEARRALVAARSSRGAAQSEVATTRANLARARSLAGEGLVSQRDLEAAQQAYDTATARLETAQSDEATAQQELERQQKLAASNVAGTAEVGAAQSTLAAAQADVRTRSAEVARARSQVRLASVALSRERATFGQNIANRREVSQAQSTVETARNALLKARQTLTVANAAYEREVRIFRQNLNNIAQVQTARSGYVQAQSDLRAARTALTLFKSAPGGVASVPIVAPISGVVQAREVAQGEVLDSDAHLMTIADLSVVHVDMFLPERDIARVRVGAPVKVNVDAVPGRLFTGRIELIHTELDPKTRTVEAHAEIPNDGALRVGMFARGQIVTSSGAAVVTVPAEALQTMEGKQVVFVQADKPNEFTAREVETGATEGGRTVIKNGLKPGEKVVVKGAFMVKAQAMKAELGHEH